MDITIDVGGYRLNVRAGVVIMHNSKILLHRNINSDHYAMIGGRVEDGETPLDAAIRECHEELSDSCKFDESLFELVMDFDEIATSDGVTKIHFYVFKYNGELKDEPITGDEIEKFLWYQTSDGVDILSNTLKNEVVPYAIENGYID